ncbi:MAG: hypothetical protein WD360_03800 [Nitriliruptoraceae bacterium]
MLWLHALASWWLVGVGVTVTLVHYPTFRDVSTDTFVTFHKRHATGMTMVVALPWVTQGLSAAWLLLGGYQPIVKVIAALSVVAVLLTVAVIVPAHSRLAHGFSDEAFSRLRAADRMRLIAFVAHALAATLAAYSYT